MGIVRTWLDSGTWVTPRLPPRVGAGPAPVRVGRGVGLILLLIASYACGDPPGVAVPVWQLTVEPTALVLLQGEAAQLAAVARRNGELMPGATVSWRSEAPTIATVTRDGQVVGLGVGGTRVFAELGSVTAEARLTVLSACRIRGVTVTPATARLRVGEQLQISPALSCPENAEVARFLWGSSDTLVAAVDAMGRVVARRAGSAVVVATLASDSSRAAAARIDVQP